MTKEIIKIKGLDCQIGYLSNLEGEEEVYCHGNDDQESCCGLDNCECDNN